MDIPATIAGVYHPTACGNPTASLLAFGSHEAPGLTSTATLTPHGDVGGLLTYPGTPVQNDHVREIRRKREEE